MRGQYLESEFKGGCQDSLAARLITCTVKREFNESFIGSTTEHT
jgi:hypothetical protein